MDSLIKVYTAIATALSSFASFRQPEQIEEVYPEHSELCGKKAGRYLLRRNQGNAEYIWFPSPRRSRLQKEALIEIWHVFGDLLSLIDFLAAYAGERVAIFVNSTPFGTATISAVLDTDKPELGMVSFTAHRTPIWNTFHQLMGNGNPQSRNHKLLAETLLDYKTHLDDPKQVIPFATFKAARNVEYSAALEGRKLHESLKVTFSLKGGPNEAIVETPEEITAAIPAYVGVWEEGKAPEHRSLFRLRLEPPPRNAGDDAQPSFRVLWANAHDYELVASRALADEVKLLAADRWPVYIGTPNTKSYVLV